MEKVIIHVAILRTIGSKPIVGSTKIEERLVGIV